MLNIQPVPSLLLIVVGIQLEAFEKQRKIIRKAKNKEEAKNKRYMYILFGRVYLSIGKGSFGGKWRVSHGAIAGCHGH